MPPAIGRGWILGNLEKGIKWPRIGLQNEGVAGMGNAVVDLAQLPDAGELAEAEALARRLQNMRFELDEVKYDWYMDRLRRQGGVVEGMVGGQEIHSPSAQLRVTPLGALGRLGVTSIADTFAEADALYDRFIRALDDEAKKALSPVLLETS